MSGKNSGDRRESSDRQTRGIGNMLQNASEAEGSKKGQGRSRRPNRNPFGESSYEEIEAQRQQQTQDDTKAQESADTEPANAEAEDTAAAETHAPSAEPGQNAAYSNAESGGAETETPVQTPEAPDTVHEVTAETGAGRAATVESGTGSSSEHVDTGASQPRKFRKRSSNEWPVPEGTQTPLVRRSDEPNVQSQFLLPETHAWVIDEMRARLKRPPYRYTKRQASQSNVVAMAIERFYEELMGEPLPEPDLDE